MDEIEILKILGGLSLAAIALFLVIQGGVNLGSKVIRVAASLFRELTTSVNNMRDGIAALNTSLQGFQATLAQNTLETQKTSQGQLQLVAVANSNALKLDGIQGTLVQVDKKVDQGFLETRAKLTETQQRYQTDMKSILEGITTLAELTRVNHVDYLAKQSQHASSQLTMLQGLEKLGMDIVRLFDHMNHPALESTAGEVISPVLETKEGNNG